MDFALVLALNDSGAIPNLVLHGLSAVIFTGTGSWVGLRQGGGPHDSGQDHHR